jgi:hypothetical protein
MSANSKLGEQIIALYRQKFTGTLTVTTQDKQQWQFNFYLGQCLWVGGGHHIYRFWCRFLAKYCPKLDTSLLVVRDSGELSTSIYYVITILLARKVIKREQAQSALESRLQETFFDLLQKEYHESLEYQLHPISSHALLKEGFNLSLSVANIEHMLFVAQQEWAKWGSKGLASCSPNLAPLLKNHRELGQKLPDIIFENMLRLLNGKNTLRDLAIKMDKDVFEVTCGLVPYFFKGYLRLLEVRDLPDFNTATTLSRAYALRT